MLRISRCSSVQIIGGYGHLNVVVSLDFVSENGVIDFISRWHHVCYKFFNIDLTFALRTKQCLIVTKIMQIS